MTKNKVPVITGDSDTDELLEIERQNQEESIMIEMTDKQCQSLNRILNLVRIKVECDKQLNYYYDDYLGRDVLSDELWGSQIVDIECCDNLQPIIEMYFNKGGVPMEFPGDRWET